MKKVTVALSFFMLNGCFIHPLPFRTATVSLKADGQPCFKVKKESVTAKNQSRILSIVINKRFEDGYMREIWSHREHPFPIKVVVPGECIPVDYHFVPNVKYNVTIYTIIPPDRVETKRSWDVKFLLQDLKPE
ncbi:putative T6SS immunity periplasmic lipoprotein [Winslowiella toletana]|uniref:putative T6SS immunity periplasmic lipoprotein n=1 Tax=Winslowiella toletana TaxID=92490 RepID=UPI0028BDE3D9|nr:putative T6SS immunity periplasmic lipoprotein [Winslowiella toletana]WNN45131.1 hypothetical protein RIN69_04275 [Winslowiella toletana]